MGGGWHTSRQHLSRMIFESVQTFFNNSNDNNTATISGLAAYELAVGSFSKMGRWADSPDYCCKLSHCFGRKKFAEGTLTVKNRSTAEI